MQLTTQLHKMIYVPVFSVTAPIPVGLISAISSNVGNFI